MEDKPTIPALRLPQTRLDRACKYLENKWFPCSSHILTKIEEIIRQPQQQINYHSLLEYIQQDYSLTLFCYKELCATDKTGIQEDNYDTPVQKLSKCSSIQLIEVLKKSLPTLKLHSIEHSKDYQIDKLKEALLALVTTKTLCEHNSLDPELGAEISLFRQIGYLLIAWNYPSIYQTARAKVSTLQSLEDNLIKALGFSPGTLALSLAQKWGLGPVFSNGSDESNQESILAPNETTSIAQSISKLCQVGEKLARANNPEIYPNALHDWEDAKTIIEEILGSNGLAIIDQAMTLECEELFIQLPQIFKAGTLLVLEDKLLAIESQHSAERNPYLENCNYDLKSELISLYNLILSGERAEKTVSLLLRKVLPHAGFCSSALFTIEPGSKKLALQLQAGDIKLREGKNLQEIKIKEMVDIVPLAFHSTDVLSQDMDQNHKTGGSLPACLATFFGCSQRFGVFYVELPSDEYKKQSINYHNRLKALAFTLNDCLELT